MPVFTGGLSQTRIDVRAEVPLPPWHMETEKRKPLPSLLIAVGAAIVLLAPMAVYLVLRAQEEGAFGRKAEPVIEKSVDKGQKSSPTRRDFTPAPEDMRKPVAPVAAPAPVAAVQKVTPPPSVQRFPSSSDVPVGMDKLKLLASFGKPNIVTTEVTEGRALETYRYLRPELGMETTVFLRSGRVVGSTSSYY